MSLIARIGGARLGLAAAGTLLGGHLSKHPVGALVGMLVGAALGHQLALELERKCPECGTLPQLLAYAG